MIPIRMSLLLAATSLAGCTTSTVFDDWSCPTPTGECSTIADVDARAAEAATGGLDELGGFPPPAKSAESASPPQSLSAPSIPAETAAPTRTADEVARIVFAPFTDVNGVYHGRAVVHAVMKDGSWVTPPAPKEVKNGL